VRVLKPNAGKWGRLSSKFVTSGDGVWYSFVGTFVSVCTLPSAIIPTVLAGQPAFMLIAAPAVWFASTIGGYFADTKEFPKYKVEQYIEARKVLEKITGELERPVAEDLVDSVWEHTLDEHRGAKSFNECHICGERVKLLRELAPSQIRNRDDIEQAKLMLETRKEVASWSERKAIG
jgi:hypothetical protein